VSARNCSGAGCRVASGRRQYRAGEVEWIRAVVGVASGGEWRILEHVLGCHRVGVDAAVTVLESASPASTGDSLPSRVNTTAIMAS